jgi:hypothetical protein
MLSIRGNVLLTRGLTVGDLAGVLAGIFAILFWAVWSSAKSYREHGRLSGIEEAVREIQKGIQSQVELENASLPADLQVAIDKLRYRLKHYRKRPSSETDPIHAQLWELGAAFGEASWLKGHAAGIRRKAPAEGRLRVDLSLTELLQLGVLANLGFRYMMPNGRLFELCRFKDEIDALDAARAISRIECAIPKQHRPDLMVQVENRECLISDCWQPNHRALA